MSPANTESESCQRILEAAEGLVRQKGFGATTVDDICKVAGVTKGVFFHYFKSKNALGLELLHRIDAEFSNEQCCGGTPQPSDSLERLMLAIDRMAHAATDPESNCCILGVFAQEMCETDAAISDLCQSICNKAMEQFTEAFQAVKDDTAPHSEIDAKALTETLFALRQGAAVMAKAQGNTDIIASVYENFKTMVRCLFKPAS
jgi:TetR/AcrR family transcriptional repressor of nem operon